MATIPWERVPKPTNNAQFDRVQIYKWAGMTTGDVGQPIFSCNHSDRSVRVDGDFGDSTVNIQGFIGDATNDSDLANDDNWLPLTDSGDSNIAIATPKIKAILPVSVGIRPSVAGGTAVSVDVYLLLKE